MKISIYKMIGTALLASVFILTTSCGINENTASSSVPPQNKTDTNISENLPIPQSKKSRNRHLPSRTAVQ